MQAYNPYEPPDCQPLAFRCFLFPRGFEAHAFGGLARGAVPDQALRGDEWTLRVVGLAVFLVGHQGVFLSPAFSFSRSST